MRLEMSSSFNSPVDSIRPLWMNENPNGHFIRFNCLLAQTANKPNTWPQLNAFRHVDVIRTTC